MSASETRLTPDTSYDVVGVGANSLDFVYVLPEIPRPDTASAKLRIAEHRLSPGGQMTTALCTCAALGLRASYVGAFGSDANGARLHDELTRRGVDVSAAVVRDAPNRYAVILVDARHGERVILWDRDPRLALSAEELPRDLLQRSRLVHVDDEDEEVALAAARLARDAGVPVTSDIDRVTDRTRALVEAVTVPMFAEHVPAALTGEPDLERALRALRRPHHAMLAVTLGARGAMLLEGVRLTREGGRVKHEQVRLKPDTTYEGATDVHRAPGFTVAVVDTTGAGDVWRGAFIHALLRGDAPGAMLRYANAAAAVACTRHGAMAGVPTPAEIEAISSQWSAVRKRDTPGG